MSVEYDKAIENLSYCLRRLTVELSDLLDDYRQLQCNYDQSERERNRLENMLKDNGIDPGIPF